MGVAFLVPRGVENELLVPVSAVGGGLISLHVDEMKLALVTGLYVLPEEPRHSNGPTVKKECTASAEN